MPAAGRLGDDSFVPADSHGSPCCDHAAIGPAVTGSRNVLINNREALRVNDRGVHKTCCGPNTWVAMRGAPAVLINDKPAHRLGDADKHCGGMGELVQGSPNVLIGDVAGPEPEKAFDQGFVVRYHVTGEPLANVRYRIVREDGSAVEGRTDAQGLTQRVSAPRPELLKLELFDDD
jgi:uncharacterized Zn-binding protein involved in type VI secretion